MIYPVTGWFEIAQYNDKGERDIANLVETKWLSRYPRPIEITYDQLSEFIGHKWIKYLIETEYSITAKPITSVNPMSNALLEQIHQVLVNLVRAYNITQTYCDKDDPWSGILDAASFAICSTTNILKGFSPSQFIFGRDMILPIKHVVGLGINTSSKADKH